MKQTDKIYYVVYDKLEDEILLTKNGDIAMYDSKDNANKDCYGNECAIPYTELPLHWENDILEQIKKTN